MAKVVFSSYLQHSSATINPVNDTVVPEGMRIITVYTDGSCKKPQSVGGWAFSAFNSNDELLIEKAEQVKVCTNNICEIQAVISALEWIKDTQNIKKIQVHVFADSQYVIRGATEWLSGWKSKQWKTAKGESVKNKDLWLKLDGLLKEMDVKFFWTKGHADDSKNNRVDELARATWS